MNLSKPVILLIDSGVWRIGLCGQKVRLIDVPLLESATAKAIAAAVTKALQESGYQGQPLVLAVPSEWCLAASIRTVDLPRHRKARDQAMRYLLEERLPLAAEEFVADFIPISSLTLSASSPPVPVASNPVTTNLALAEERMPSTTPEPVRRLGVAVALERLATLVDALESQGVAIGPVCPESLLALQASCSRENLPIDATIFWEIQNHLEAFAWSSGTLVGWNLIEPGPAALERYLSVGRLQNIASLPCVLVNCSGKVAAVCQQSRQCSVRGSSPSAENAIEAAEKILAGTVVPWINLRRDALAALDRYRMVKRPLRAILAGTLLLTLCLIGALWIQAFHYDSQAIALESRQEEIFQKLYPGAAIPSGIRARLQSEVQRLRATSGDSADLPNQGSALTTMYEVLRRLPTDVKFRLLDMRFAIGEFSLEGQSKSHGDADVIASALHRQKGFVVEPTRTEQLSTGQVSFTITGTSLAPFGAAPEAMR